MPDRVANQAAINGVTTAATGLSGATTGAKLTYTVPAGRQAKLTCAFIGSVSGGAPTVTIQVTVGGVTLTIASTTTGTNTTLPIALSAGDSVAINVTAAIAATTFIGLISVDEYLAA